MLKYSINKIQSTRVPVETHIVKSEDVLEISCCHVMETERGEVGKQILHLKPQEIATIPL